MEYGLVEIADLYVKDKGGIIRLMAEEYKVVVDGSTPHAIVIQELKRLYDHNPNFRADLRELMYENGIIGEYSQAIGTIITGALTAIGGAIGGITDLQRSKIEAQAQEDKFFQDYILNKQRQSNTGTIVLISVVSLGVVGLAAWLILRKR